MHIKDFIGKPFSPEAISQYNPTLFPDDYDTPCYRITLPSSDLVEVEAYWYLEILLNTDGTIQKIQKNKEDFFANTILTRFPPVVEDEAEKVLKIACALPD